MDAFAASEDRLWCAALVISEAPGSCSHRGLINSDTELSTKLLTLPCFVPEARTKCTGYLKHREARQRSASTDGIAESARKTWATEILSQLLGEVVAAAPSRVFFFFLPSNQSGEKLQERKRFIMLTETTWPQNQR